MKLFKNKKLKEEPLGYWEEKSYMLAIIEKYEKEEFSSVRIIESITNMDGINVKGHHFNEEEGKLYVNLEYQNLEYEVGIYPSNFNLPNTYINESLNFSKKELENIRNSESAIVVFMKFSNDAKKSFHLQIKLILAIAPNLVGLIDESAERLLSVKWAKILASSKIPPSAKDLFNIHAVCSSTNEVWLHTHGLARCNVTELEILQSDIDNCEHHSHLLNAYAEFIIDKKGKFNPHEEPICIGILSNRTPIIVICKSWVDAIGLYDKLELGGIADRKEGHNSKTSPIFVYKNIEDKENNKLSKVTIFNDLLAHDPIYFLSEEETLRMKSLAIERFDYLKKGFENKENKAIVKIGLKVDKSKKDSGVEHIWFEIVEFKGDKFKARLTQEPYNIKDIKINDERWFKKEDITDFEILTSKGVIYPSSVYLLDDDE